MDYTGGIKDTIDKLEIYLVEYAEAIKKNNDDGSFVHHIFRFAHNLKSALAMNHKEYCSHLIHAAENNFDLIRKGLATPTKGLIQNCLYAIDLIKDNLDKSEEDVLDLEGQTRILQKISEQLISSEKLIPKISLALYDNEYLLYEKASELKCKYYQIEKLISNGINQDEFSALPILNDLNEDGLIITFFPDVKNLPKFGNEFVLTIIYASPLNFTELEFKIFDPYKEIEIEKIEKKNKSDNSDNKVIEYTPPVKKDFKALIVDDEEITQNLLKNILSDFGHCEIAKDGIDSLRIFKNCLEKKDPFDLICLDINMPVKNGQQTLKEIRELEAGYSTDLLSRVKILMITALKDVKNKMTSFKDQCDGYITKPIDYDLLIKKLKRMNLIK